MPLVNRRSRVLLRKENIKQKFKLPNIKKPISNFNQKSRNSIQSMKRDVQQRLKSKQKQLNTEKNKSVTIATRLDTDDVTMLEDASMSSLLKVETKSLHKSNEVQPFSSLKTSKISNPEIDKLKKCKQFLERQNLLSKNVLEQNRLNDLSRIKSIERVSVEEQESTGSQTSEEYIKDSVPGPGSYSISHHTSFSKPSLKSHTTIQSRSRNLTFGSKQVRFKAEKKEYEKDKNYLQKLQYLKHKQADHEERMMRLYKRQKKVVAFNCKEEPKSPPKQNLSQSLISPVYYNPRNGIEQELIKKIQRNFKGGFGFSEKRFKAVYKKNNQLGPGSYSIDVGNPQQTQDNKMAYYFMSKKGRFQ